ncbi:MAG: WbqC family protein [Acidocella sp.]|nr:WbqC family protein [Acidocella sp.]
MKVVISQPMFFPWIGMFEQIRQADIYVYYGDVQFSKGSFTNRVQIKTARGVKWLTVPLRDFSLGQTIDDVKISVTAFWRAQHLDVLKQAYSGAPYRNDMLSLVETVYQQSVDSIGALSRRSMEACCDYYGLFRGRRFVDVRQLGIGGSSSRRVLDVVRVLGGTSYITGLGARNYLDHQLFDDAFIRVEYMDYKKMIYPQLHGEFTPYVSILDLIANTGREGVNWIQSGTIYWQDYLKI